MAIWCFAIYRTTSSLRHSAPTSSEVSLDMLMQFARDGVCGHRYATSVLASRPQLVSRPQLASQHLVVDPLEQSFEVSSDDGAM